MLEFERFAFLYLNIEFTEQVGQDFLSFVAKQFSKLNVIIRAYKCTIAVDPFSKSHTVNK